MASVIPSEAGAVPPQVISSAVEGVSATSTTLQASIDAEGLKTTYRFEYITEAAYEANLAAVPPRDPFLGATLIPSGAEPVGSGSGPVLVHQRPVGLTPSTAYRYRVRAENSSGAVLGTVRPFATQDATNAFTLPDNRGWEMVSPLDKDGGTVGVPGQVADGGVFQAAADGQSLTYSSADSFAAGEGAPAGSQYLAQTVAGGWDDANITPPLLSGSYGDSPDGVPYQLFSADLSSALLSNGERCRGSAGGTCPVANPPLAGSGAPPGYRNYYLRSDDGGFKALLGSSDFPSPAPEPEEFELRFLGATPDLRHVLLSSCAALTGDAIEVPATGGCDPEAQNLYEWSTSGLSLVNVLPGDTQGTPGAVPAARAGAISADGSRVYWSNGANLYLRAGGQTAQVDASVGGGGTFQVASAEDGVIAYFTAAEHLYRYSAASGNATDLTPAGGVKGVLGDSADGAVVYYSSVDGLFRRQGSEATEVAPASVPPAVASADYPPATGSGRVSADGEHLAFVSSAELTGYPSEGVSEVYLYGPTVAGGPAVLTCVSCNPTGERPLGSASIPGAVANGHRLDASLYKPRVLSDNGLRIFFESSDGLVTQDTNERDDVYEWEASGVGTCTRAGGCIGLISGGRSSEDSFFLDASADGSDAFFLTSAPLDPRDPGSYDAYDARIGGGFSLPPNQIPCIGDACQQLPEAPEDPTPGTLIPNSGNPPLKKDESKKKTKKPKKQKKHHRRKRHGGGRQR
jgi:hypothetical protein